MASVSASRTASITLAGDASRSSFRNNLAAREIHRKVVFLGSCQICSYQPGDSTPAPYPEREVSLEFDQGIHVPVIFSLEVFLRVPDLLWHAILNLARQEHARRHRQQQSPRVFRGWLYEFLDA